MNRLRPQRVYLSISMQVSNLQMHKKCDDKKYLTYQEPINFFGGLSKMCISREVYTKNRINH